MKLALVFTDWMLSWWALWRRASKNGLVLVERGWWDMAVDPRRYRLANNLTGVTRTLGRLLPRPGYVLVCAGDPADLHARKPEIGEPEVQRQLAEWRRLAPEIAHTVVEVDTTKQSPYEAVSKVFESTARSKENWRLVPLAAPRLSLRAWGDPAALAVYRPFSKKARWSACFYPTFVRTGLGRQVGPPVPNISALARKLGWEITGLASFRSSAPGRWVIGVARLGSLVSVIKLGASDDRGLRSEAGWLNRLRSVQSPFRVPRLISHGNWQGHYYIATEAVTAVTSTATLNEAEMVAVSLAHGLDGFGPVVHGDLAPWNLLPTEDGLLVLDWEEARTGRDASGDLIRFVMRAGADLHRFSPANAARHILRATLARDGSVADVTEPLASLELELVRATEERDERLVRFIRKAAWYLDRCAMTLLSADETQGSRRGL